MQPNAVHPVHSVQTSGNPIGAFVTVTMLLPAELVEKLAEFAAVQTAGSVGELAAETLFEKWAPHLSRLGRMDAAA
jgi:hypothetical protein